MSKAQKAITDILQRHRSGDDAALEELFHAVYENLHRMAQSRMRGERSNHTLQPTALVNELFLKMLNLERIEFKDRSHFFALAATVMRRILVDHARARRADKRGGGEAWQVAFDEAIHSAGAADSNSPDVEQLDRLLDELAKRSERQSKIVEMRYFGGLTIEEVAEAMSISSDTVGREWKRAKLWLHNALRRA